MLTNLIICNLITGKNQQRKIKSPDRIDRSTQGLILHDIIILKSNYVKYLGIHI